jgi:hypothetical protein
MRVAEIAPEAERVMRREFLKRTPSSIVARLVLQETGFGVKERTISRRASEFRAQQLRRQAAREQVSDLVAAMRENDFTAAEMIQALATQALMESPEKFQMADPIAVQGQNLKAEELRLKQEQLDLRKRAAAIEEKKLELLLAREAKVVAAAAELDKGAVSPDDFRRRIHEIYGLGQAAQASEGADARG